MSRSHFLTRLTTAGQAPSIQTTSAAGRHTTTQLDTQGLPVLVWRLAMPDAGKHPMMAHGVKDATTNAAQIDSWWHPWPDANIGLAVGGAAGIVIGGTADRLARRGVEAVVVVADHAVGRELVDAPERPASRLADER